MEVTAPGSYRLRVVSNRVHAATAEDEPGSQMKQVPLTSNTVQFEVTTATPEWQAQQLAEAVSILDTPGSTDGGPTW